MAIDLRIKEEMELSLKGKIALVSGSSRGIGRAIAIGLAKEGADVIVNYRTRERDASKVVLLIEEAGGKALPIQADVSSFEDVEAMFREAERRFGPIDILVNNAMIHKGGKIHRVSLQDWDLVIKSSLYGAFHCCKMVIPSMLERGWGRIINISSPVGERGYPGDGAYGAAKAGLLGFTKSIARELAPHGITANVVMPGFVRTEATMALGKKSIKNLKESIPMGRLCKAEDVADMVTYLISKGDYITGSIHHVDGGMGM